MSRLGTSALCKVCCQNIVKYTCPKCSIRYCSLGCYKAHGEKCTENFYKENAVNELKSIRATEIEKSKMLEFLKKLHLSEKEESLDDVYGYEETEEEMDFLSSDTIRKLNSGIDISFESLSLEEKASFQKALSSGQLSRLIQPWIPWWTLSEAEELKLSSKGTRLVTSTVKSVNETSQDDSLSISPNSTIPDPPSDPILPLKKLTSSPPSPLLAIHLSDIIYGYCFTLRLYNGDWTDDSVGAAEVLFSISGVLGQSEAPETVDQAISGCLEKVNSPEWKSFIGSEKGLPFVEDVAVLIGLGRAVVICALMDVRRMIESAIEELEKSKSLKSSVRGERGEKRGLNLKKLKVVSKKVGFFLSWSNENGSEVFDSLADLIRGVAANKMSDLDSHSVKINSTTAKITEL